ncbi:MAG: phosphatase PAP2 family protein [Xanthomonadales bacterium]|nr:phosphatase PAP2 family protein [Xanthomonadales bacterium]
MNALARAPLWRTLLVAVSRLGDGPLWYALILGLALAGELRAALAMASSGLAGLLLYRALKRRTRRPRPCAACPGIVALTAPLDEHSFPSGHTMHAVAFAAIAAALVPALAWWLIPFALLTALSRPLLGLHYPSDVLAGAALGLGLGLAATLLVA